MVKLPDDFKLKMANLLKEEYDPFIKSYHDHKVQGLRINTLKVSIDQFLSNHPFHLENIPWTKDGFYYAESDQPGKHPYHEAGLYYIQEPSAMAVGQLVNAKPGEKVLDLCAAPGGKTTHIASSMNQEGLLVANEIHPTRAKVLSHNVERLGIKNAIVTNESPNRLAKRFPSYFDKILVDAPCSGEGMFRKNPEACMEWSLKNVAACVIRQEQILSDAHTMLRPGGRLVYSTCTFSPEENEGVIDSFLKENPNYEIERIESYEPFDRGRVDWIADGIVDLQHTVRIWPHKIKGEGHFIAVLKKVDGEEPELFKHKGASTVKNTKQLQDYFQFAKEFLKDAPQGKFVLFGEKLYLLPDKMIKMDRLKIIRPGWHLGVLKKNRFEPSHALALGLHEDQVKYHWNLNSTSDEIIAYLKGETLKADGEKGWYLVEVDGYSIGWGKVVNNQLKNHYPKGLRWKGNFS